MLPTLPDPYYYLENFQRVLDWIGQRYSDLLSDEERGFIEQFPRLPQASRALLVRMVMRKGEVFRSGKLVYAEIACPDAAARPLLELDWLWHNPPLSIAQLFALLRKAELLRAFRITGAGSLNRKSDLQAELEHTFPEVRPLNQWAPDITESIYEVRVAALCERLRLMFFGNLYQDWSEFVLSDLGIYRYEQVEFSESSRGFRSRQDIDDYLHLQRCRVRFDEGNYLDEIVPDIPRTPYANLWLEGRRNKLLFRFAQEYERCQELDSALELYRQCSYAGARSRTIRVLEKNDAVGEALELAEAALSQPESEAEHQAVLRMLPRLRRKLGHAKLAPGKAPVIEAEDLTLPYPAVAISVEQAVQEHLSSTDAPVFYVENTLINSLFGLLCWPAVFAALPGAFFHPFHQGPVDLHSADFVHKRQEIFDQCLARLDDGSYRQTIADTFAAKEGIQSPFVFWGTINEDLLKLALHCIPAAHLKKYFARILRDIPANRSGLPDLIQFWPQEQRYRMLEVKGPGDRLQDNQVRWLNYCIEHQMPVAVTYVQWLEQAA
ncbi:VRR-NUC domain-containing protein [Herminiimonas glaciei]|uniref:phosphodiesterase I n=1 Tax=Herminiimonas glaciei TaxID=523788 RepID=A0ABW2I8S5_9BURK